MLPVGATSLLEKRTREWNAKTHSPTPRMSQSKEGRDAAEQRMLELLSLSGSSTGNIELHSRAKVFPRQRPYSHRKSNTCFWIKVGQVRDLDRVELGNCMWKEGSILQHMCGSGRRVPTKPPKSTWVVAFSTLAFFGQQYGTSGKLDFPSTHRINSIFFLCDTYSFPCPSCCIICGVTSLNCGTSLTPKARNGS